MVKPKLDPVHYTLLGDGMFQVGTHFDYKEMVKETRRKYEKLPEVLNAKYEARRTSSYRTNRLMADIYQRKLKDHVLKGKISLNHSFNIIT